MDLKVSGPTPPESWWADLLAMTGQFEGSGHQWAFLLAAQKQMAIDRWINGHVVNGNSPATFLPPSENHVGTTGRREDLW